MEKSSTQKMVYMDYFNNRTYMSPTPSLVIPDTNITSPIP